MTPSLGQQPADLFPGLLQSRRLGLGAHERVVIPADARNDALIGQLAQPLEREDGIDVLLEARAVEVDREVRHAQVGKVDVAGDQSVLDRAGIEGPVVFAMHTGRRDDRHG